MDPPSETDAPDPARAARRVAHAARAFEARFRALAPRGPDAPWDSGRAEECAALAEAADRLASDVRTTERRLAGDVAEDERGRLLQRAFDEVCDLVATAVSVLRLGGVASDRLETTERAAQADDARALIEVLELLVAGVRARAAALGPASRDVELRLRLVDTWRDEGRERGASLA